MLPHLAFFPFGQVVRTYFPQLNHALFRRLFDRDSLTIESRALTIFELPRGRWFSDHQDSKTMRALTPTEWSCILSAEDELSQPFRSV